MNRLFVILLVMLGLISMGCGRSYPGKEDDEEKTEWGWFMPTEVDYTPLEEFPSEPQEEEGEQETKDAKD